MRALPTGGGARQFLRRGGPAVLVALAVDLLAFNLLLAAGADVVWAHTAAFAAATAAFLLRGGSRLALATPAACLRAGAVWVLAVLLRGGILSALIDTCAWPAGLAILPAAAGSAAVALVGARQFVVAPREASGPRWPAAAACIVAYVLLLRLTYIGSADLIPQEAYYWLYSRHLALSYLDHPPMVAWLIRVSTAAFGSSELAVRLPVYLCWFVTAAFVFGLTRPLAGAAAAHRSLILVAVLPIYFGMGLLMIPDASLHACWAGCLYYLHRALLGERRGSWVGVGVCLGLGMLSKYTISLLAPAILLFVALDRRSRRWLARPEPYVALACAAALLTPVLIWNATHDWASLRYHGSARWSDEFTFAPYTLVGAAAVLLTPVGLLAACKLVLQRRSAWPDGPEGSARGRLFALVFTLVPLGVFLAFSCARRSKLNWTGPLWLALLPALAWDMAARAGGAAGRLTHLLRRAWMPTVTVLLLGYAGGLYYLALGTPGLQFGREMSVPVAWEELAGEAAALRRQHADPTGRAPMLVGMDKNFVSSEMAFYQSAGAGGRSEISGRHLFDKGSRMWSYWRSPADPIGRDILMVDLEPQELRLPRLPRYFQRIGEVGSVPVRKRGRTVAHLYWRMGHGYRYPPAPKSADATARP